MAKQSKLELLSSRKEEIANLYLEGKESRQKAVNITGFATSNSLYIALREAGWIPGGPMPRKESDGDKAPHTKRTKGCLPAIVEQWVRDGLFADFLFNGGDRDDWESPEVITPDIFLNHRPVVNETKAYSKILNRIGGINSEAGVALRAWAGKPLTSEQSELESMVTSNKVTRQIDNQIFLLANSASKAVRAVIFSLFCDETLMDRRLNGGFLPF